MSRDKRDEHAMLRELQALIKVEPEQPAPRKPVYPSRSSLLGGEQRRFTFVCPEFLIAEADAVVALLHRAPSLYFSISPVTRRLVMLEAIRLGLAEMRIVMKR